MIELLVTVMLMMAGCLVVVQLYDFVNSETARSLLIVGYGLFVVFMVFHLFADYILNQLSNL